MREQDGPGAGCDGRYLKTPLRSWHPYRELKEVLDEATGLGGEISMLGRGDSKDEGCRAEESLRAFEDQPRSGKSREMGGKK